MGITSLKSPGIEVQEWDLTSYVEASGVAAGAIVGSFSWGPIDQIKMTSNESKLNAMFGLPTNENYFDWFSAKNFLEYSRTLNIVRVASTDALNATSSASGLLIKNDDAYVYNYELGTTLPTPLTVFAAKYAGSLGNSLKVEMVDGYSYSGLDQDTIVLTSAGSLYTTVAEHGDPVTFSAPLAVGGVAATGTLNVVGDVVTGITITNCGTGYTKADTIVVTIPAPAAVGGTVATATIGLWQYRNQFLAAPGTSDSVVKLGGANDELHVIIVDKNGSFTGEANVILERFSFVSKCKDAKSEDGTSMYYKNVLRDQSAYVYGIDHPVEGTNWGGVGSVTFINQTDIEQYVLAHGSDGATVTNDEKFPGWDMFKNKETTDVGLLISGNADNVLKDYIIQSIAGHRGDCVAFISPNMDDVVYNIGSELDDVLITRNVLTSSTYTVMDCNWKYQFDVHNNTFRWLPCNADTAGLCAQVDIMRDPWWSPAGLERGHIKNVVKLAWNPDNTDRDSLYVNGVNAIITLAGEGTVLYGDKTMTTKQSAFDHINVRRLFIVLEKSIAKSAKYMLFEFNDFPTRLKFKLMVEPFLRHIQGARGIIDSKVVCDVTNNTPQVIDTNSFVGDIYVKPNKSINYIHLNFVATPTGIDFTVAVDLMYGGQNMA